MITHLVAGIWRLQQKIGIGSFGELWWGINISSGSECAIKLETRKTRHPQLAHEYKVYRHLAGGAGIPNVHWFGREGDYNVMVMDLLGPSLEDLFNFCSRKFTMKSVLMLADQLLTRIEYTHTKSFLHRDIKPHNFLIGKQNLVYIIDFGLSKMYRNPYTHKHIPLIAHKSLIGTARYASIYAHLGFEQGRKDDLQSLGYMLMFFSRGDLPWEGVMGNTRKERHSKIVIKKMNTPNELLCKNFPKEFTVYMNYCGSLRFEEKPDYSFLRRLFRNVFCRQGYAADNRFDWTFLRHERNKEEELSKIIRRIARRYKMSQNQRSKIHSRDVGRDYRVIGTPHRTSCLHYNGDFNNRLVISHV